ncbi:MAG: pyridoxal phosphate-dependent aminotransferase [Nitrospirota bacterium]
MRPAVHIAQRMASIQPFFVMDLLARARQLEAQGRSIIHMEIGEPDFPTPEPVVRAGIEAVARGDLHYTPALGLPALREAIASFYRQRYGVAVPAERIVITPGGSGALLLALGVLVDPGQRFLLAEPGYPCNRHFVRFVNGEPAAIPVGVESRYQLTAALVADHWRPETVGALVASPANPTGTVVAPDELTAIVAAVEGRDGHVICDEIYHGLVYGGEAATALASSDQVFVVNSFSKYFHMTGWRLGWLVVPDGYVAAADRLAQNLFLAASTPAQHAALAAFRPDNLAILDARRDELRQRRDFLLPALRDLGFRIPVTPDGAFYLYADCTVHSDESFAFAERLLEEAGVAITPGRDFGSHQPERHLRFAYTTSMANLEEGVRRLRTFLA